MNPRNIFVLDYLRCEVMDKEMDSKITGNIKWLWADYLKVVDRWK